MIVKSVLPQIKDSKCWSFRRKLVFCYSKNILKMKCDSICFLECFENLPPKSHQIVLKPLIFMDFLSPKEKIYRSETKSIKVRENLSKWEEMEIYHSWQWEEIYPTERKSIKSERKSIKFDWFSLTLIDFLSLW